ncbi:MAG: hypothetical protein ACREA0_31695, partial [bacterium]
SEWLASMPWRPRPPFARVVAPDHAPLRDRLLVGYTEQDNRVAGADFSYYGDHFPVTGEDRKAAAREWIEQMLLDMGVTDVRPYLQRLPF